jgi:hypothetical protein
MLCEAGSGAYGPADRNHLRLNESALAAQAALHFVHDGPRENLARIVELRDPPDVGIAAALMLAALHDANGARPRGPRYRGPAWRNARTGLRHARILNGPGVPPSHSAAST